MSQEQQLATELNNMLNEDRIPLSISEDIHEICERLQSGEMNINDLQGSDAFIVEAVEEALNRIQQNSKRQ
ncbi:hypothetical protein [Halalkalibacter urbisdiaboli]|uniref:hypothetical protein n=1 Tax=Halalkalibacter urbisdiaboli TaxID=1960589 RepID=UPI000B438D72|nr:hypothetical protein [Halalkalibacter urbisdiaboli]